MLKYFNNCHNSNDLRKEYLKLIKQYHPDLAKNESEFEKLNTICAEINSEYELICGIIPKAKESHTIVDSCMDNHIINGSEDARNAYAEIEEKISILPIDYDYYYSRKGVKWWEDQIFMEKANNIALFWNLCSTTKIVGDEFAKLFELSDFNVEKMRRTVMFLSTGAIAEDDIHTNLKSNNSIPFFDNNIKVDNLPDYNSFLLFSKENIKSETMDAWIEFCQKQRDNFTEKFYEVVVPKISSGMKK